MMTTIAIAVMTVVAITIMPTIVVATMTRDVAVTMMPTVAVTIMTTVVSYAGITTGENAGCHDEDKNCPILFAYHLYTPYQRTWGEDQKSCQHDESP